MINKETLSDKLIEGIQEVYLSYGRQRGTVPPGTYRGFLTEIVEVRSFPNPPLTLLTLNFATLLVWFQCHIFEFWDRNPMPHRF